MVYWKLNLHYWVRIKEIYKEVFNRVFRLWVSERETTSKKNNGLQVILIGLMVSGWLAGTTIENGQTEVE